MTWQKVVLEDRAEAVGRPQSLYGQESCARVFSYALSVNSSTKARTLSIFGLCMQCSTSDDV